MRDLLFEIGTEEIPAGYLGPAIEQLQAGVEKLLAEQRLPARRVWATGTPRRLVVAAEGLPDAQPSVVEEVVGPPAKAAFGADGAPTKAALGFARSKGVPVESLKVKETPKGPYAVAVVAREGASAMAILPGVLREATLGISFPKSMRWPVAGGAAEGAAVRFARPIRWLVALLGADVVPVEIAGLKAGRVTYGHPFLAPGSVELQDASFAEYLRALSEHFVMVHMLERLLKVGDAVEQLTKKYGSHSPIVGPLGEVHNLVEWPRAIEGSFDEKFLEIPDCVVCAAMIEHQRYFPVWDKDERLLNRFIIISNRGPEQDDTVREGNQRVLRARLEDARFFWNEDRKTPLAECVARLKGVVYLGGLGNNLQRTERLEGLSVRIAGMMGLEKRQLECVRRAAHLCKADLATELVGEFPSLQGMVGRELALNDGETEAVADAIAEHYRPESVHHSLPKSMEGTCLALADKLDVMAGCFALGHLPSGNQDPYALRRNALGVLLILEAKDLKLRLSDLLDAVCEALDGQAEELAAGELAVPRPQVLEFFRDRLYHAAIERGHLHDLVRAVLSVGFDHPTPIADLNHNVSAFWNRLKALSECSQKPWWPALVELVDRTYRIQRDLEGPAALNPKLLKEPLEREVGAVLAENSDEIAGLLDAGRYVEGAERYASVLAQKVHDFFEKVFVNVDDEALKRNRKSLCAAVYHLFADRFADLYVIQAAQGRQ